MRRVAMGDSGVANNVNNDAHKFDVLKRKLELLNMEEFNRPDLPSRCTWHVGANPADSPHTKVPYEPRKKILPNILHAIGNSPMVRLNHVPQSEGIKCEMLAKCEFLNPGGSVKDRIGFRMVEDAEKQGILKPGYTIIEPTSGNTGIGLAMAAAVKGYRCIIVMPDKMSNEKVDVLRALGAEILRTPTAAAFDSPEGLIAVSQKLMKDIPNAVILDQYRNPGNPLAHYDLTAEEIYDQCDGKIDMIVVGAGTGGTVTGTGRRLKELCPKATFVAIDPVGSILAQPESLNISDTTFYELEGIGYDFLPTVLDRSIVDKWMKVDDVASFTMARRLIKEEGLLCGGSSGAAVAIAIRAAKDLRADQRCVVLLPDSIRNYLTKFVSDQWLEARHFRSCPNTENHWWWDEPVAKLKLGNPLTIPADTTCAGALNLMKMHGFHQLPVVNADGVLTGVAAGSNLLSALISAKVQPNDPISNSLITRYLKIQPDTSLGLASRILEKEPFVLVTKSEGKKDEVVRVITSIDVLSYITGGNAEEKNGTS